MSETELNALLADYPLVIDIPVAWGEMDALGHVNNTVYFRYFESVRIAYFERIGFLESVRSSGIGPILASAYCRFRKPLTFPDQISVGTRAEDLARDRFVMRFRIVSRKMSALAAEGEGLIISFNYREGNKAPLPDAVRRQIEALEKN